MQFPVIKYNHSKESYLKDSVVAETPLRLVLIHSVEGIRQKVDLGITLCTPDHPLDLMRGWLYHHQLINLESVCQIHLSYSESEKMITASTNQNLSQSLDKINRIGFRSTSCGYCGDLDLVLNDKIKPISFNDRMAISKQVLSDLGKTVWQHQKHFQSTGSIHAAATFDLSGSLVAIREDIGRHNALDKLTGNLLTKRTNFTHSVLWLSSRMSFEMAHKASVAGYPIVVSVGGPSSMAIQFCHRQKITLIGFCRENRYNIYTYPERIHS